MTDPYGTHVVGGHEGSDVCWIDPAYDENGPDDLAPVALEATATLFTAEREKLAAQGLKMARREQWGARRAYTDTRSVTMPAKRFFLHVAVIGSSGSFASRMRTIESIGISRFPNTGASYNCAVDFDGTLGELQPLGRRGAHTVVEYAPNKMGLPNGHNANYDSRALVLPQNCPDRVTDKQIDSAARWAAAQIRAGLAVRGAKWYGHRDAARKSCPCNAGYARIPRLQQLTDQYAANGLSPTTPPEVDMTPAEMLAAKVPSPDPRLNGWTLGHLIEWQGRMALAQRGTTAAIAKVVAALAAGQTVAQADLDDIQATLAATEPDVPKAPEPSSQPQGSPASP